MDEIRFLAPFQAGVYGDLFSAVGCGDGYMYFEECWQLWQGARLRLVAEYLEEVQLNVVGVSGATTSRYSGRQTGGLRCARQIKGPTL